MELYSPVFVQTYKNSKSKMPLHVWANAIGKKMPCFLNNPSSVYNTISLGVKLKGGINDSDGTVNLKVAPMDQDWYPKLQSALSEMTGVESHQLEVQDYLGQPIKEMSIDRLSGIGELDIVNKRTGKLVRLEKVVPPPEHMATNKMTTISRWFEGAQDTIASAIADTLQGKTMAEISTITTKDNLLQKNIEQALKRSHGNLDNFMHTYAMDNASRATSAEDKTTRIAQSILHHVRRGLAANETQIRAFHASNASSGGQELWSQHNASIAGQVKYKDERSMYLDIAEDALYDKILGRKVQHLVYRGDRRHAVGSVVRRKNPTFKERHIGSRIKETPSTIGTSTHPLKSFYDNHYYPKFKKYPGHVIEKFNAKTHIGEKAGYPGNPERAQRMFRMFSGRHTAPIASELPRLVPLKKTEPSINEELPRLVPLKKAEPSINEEMPRLVPLKKAPEAKKVGHRLVPIDVNEELPRLVPLKKTEPSINEELPRLVPLKKAPEAKKVGHRLVPINQGIKDSKPMPRLVPLQKAVGHRLVPLDSRSDFDDISREIAREDLETDVFGLPNLSAFLPKKR